MTSTRNPRIVIVGESGNSNPRGDKRMVGVQYVSLFPTDPRRWSRAVACKRASALLLSARLDRLLFPIRGSPNVWAFRSRRVADAFKAAAKLTNRR